LTQKTFELLIGTGNRGKIVEISSALEGLPLRLRTLAEFPELLPPAETGDTYEENAVLKAIHYARAAEIWTLADDSGLEVQRLGNLPGVRTARYGGDGLTDSERISVLLRDLGGSPERHAAFHCVIVIACGDSYESVEGRCEGEIADGPRGSGGFGYDPIFIPRGYSETFAELPAEIKAKISHRGQALTKIRHVLAKRLTASQ
jgi:XTP/dITP diphosphohydrolase